MPADPALIYYVGPLEVDVPLARLEGVKYGDQVRVEDPQVRAGLLAQPGNWSTDEPPKTRPADVPVVTRDDAPIHDPAAVEPDGAPAGETAAPPVTPPAPAAAKTSPKGE